MVTLIIIFIPFFVDVDISVHLVIVFFRVFFLVGAFESTLRLVVLPIGATFAPEARLCLPHLIEACGIVTVTLVMVFKDLVF